MKITATVEIEIPDDYPDQCWTSEGCGPQVIHDLLINPARNHYFAMLGKAANWNDLDKATRENFTKTIEAKMGFIDTITVR